ncbi:sugar phosphate permease [Sporomusaceae bacterium BoRhaA]|uniref:MFS transporter n=1 Tax=Pelorhabdus rhamnosifermentans TaxID=2772457 RepID=UPI001C06473E|nr:MFS transporter [Pelorhabdus rhamnosifermentans]MBU2699990.1 sugar phosphate permease [Pelorhabdus rhamnosifermentans]
MLLTAKRHKIQRAETVTRYRWFVLAFIFVIYTLSYGDRANIGVVLPVIKAEFQLSNFEAGSLASFFFVGYALTQIPAGFWYSLFGVKKLMALSMIMVSVFTGLIGTSGSAFMIKMYRLGLGLAEGPTPVGMAATINTWFPPKEKGIASGIYLAAAKFAPVIVPPICVAIMQSYGWRYVFYWFALPGIILAAGWYFLIKDRPEESPFCSPGEVDYIKNTAVANQQKEIQQKKSFLWLDKLIHLKHVSKIETNAQIFCSWNIWGNTFGYCLMLSVVNGILTWIPSYLVNEKHFSFIKMGFVASAPWIGAVLGNLIGGWIADKIFDKRRKPLMLVSTLSTAIMMLLLINSPADARLLGIMLFFTGFLLNLGFSAFTAYPMGLTTKKTFPIAIAVVNSGGHLGSVFSPMFAGFLLDKFNYGAVFSFFALCAALSLLVILTVDEPIQE